ncbi:cytochrome c, partial [Streptococcus pneumoniae]
ADTNATMWVHFEGEMAQGGHAKDEIWTDPEGFKAKTEAFTSSINALALAASEAASAADVEASYGEMASQCGSCHKA